MAVVEPRGIDRPARRPGILQDGGADSFDPPGERRDIILYLGFRLGHRCNRPVGEIIDQIDQKVPGPHGGIADFQFQQPFRRIEFLQPRKCTFAIRAVTWQSPGRVLEGAHARRDQRIERLRDDEADQIVGRVVAAGILAGENVGADGDAVAVANDLLLQQTFVDRAELLHAEFAVVDIAPALWRSLEREGVDDIGDYRVAEPDIGQQGRALPVEQPAIVGRQADGGVAAVDGTAEIVDGRPVAGRRGGKHVLQILAAPDILADIFPQRIIVIAIFSGGQQVPIFGVEDEQKPVEQDQRGLAHLGQRCARRGAGDGVGEVGKDLLEDDPGQVLGDPFLIEAAFVERAPVEGPLVGRIRQEGLAPEHEGEDLEPMAARSGVEREQAVVAARQVQDRRQIDLEELFGDRERALPVETPVPPVGQDAPAQPAVRQIVGPAQIAQHLGGRRGHFAGLRRSAVERAAPSLRLDNGEAEFVAPPFLEETVGPVLALRIGEQQAVGHIHHALGREVLLAEPFGPAKQPENGPDQVVLGLAFVGRSAGREAGEDVIQPGFERVERSLVERLPVVRLRNRHAKKIAREKAALKRPVDAHAAARPVESRPLPRLRRGLRLFLDRAAGLLPAREAAVDVGDVGQAHLLHRLAGERAAPARGAVEHQLLLRREHFAMVRALRIDPELEHAARRVHRAGDRALAPQFADVADVDELDRLVAEARDGVLDRPGLDLGCRLPRPGP